MSTIQTFWRENHSADEHWGRVHTQCRRITCSDGYDVSVQASEYHYCAPRTYLSDGAYLAWELGFPTEHDELLDPYAEDPENPLDTVYGWVPTEVVDALIEKHGGLAVAALKDHGHE